MASLIISSFTIESPIHRSTSQVIFSLLVTPLLGTTYSMKLSGAEQESSFRASNSLYCLFALVDYSDANFTSGYI